MTKEKDVSRRGYVKYAGAGIVVIAVAGAGAYYATRPGPSTPTPTTPKPTPTEKPTEKPTETPTQPPAGTIFERAIDGIKKLLDEGKVPKGITLNEMCEGGFQANAQRLGLKKFYELSGLTENDLTVNVVEVPALEVVHKMMEEAAAKTGAFDIFAPTNHPLLPDFIGANLIVPVDSYVAEYNPEYDDVMYPFPHWQYGGHYWGVPCDGDVFLTFYRKDLIDSQEEKDSFKSKYGYDLEFPETWDQYRDILEFFTRKKGEKLDGETLEKDFFGATEWRVRGYTYFWFLQRLASLNPDPKNVYFDSETMEPMISTEKAVKALEDLTDMNQFMHPDILSWDYVEPLASYAQNEAWSNCSWLGVGKYIENPETSIVIGKSGYAPPPGYIVDGKLIRRSMMPLTYTFTISNYSKYQELAYLYTQAVSAPEISSYTVGISASNSDPHRWSQQPLLQDLWSEGSKPYGEDSWAIPKWPKGKEFLDGVASSFKQGFPILIITGYEEYTSSLELAIQAYFHGEKSAEKALNDAADDWRRITKERGLEEQKDQYQKFVNLISEMQARVSKW